jgi:hypothetical protein
MCGIGVRRRGRAHSASIHSTPYGAPSFVGRDARRCDRIERSGSNALCRRVRITRSLGPYALYASAPRSNMEPAAFTLITASVAMVAASMLTYAAGYAIGDASDWTLRVFSTPYEISSYSRRIGAYTLVALWIAFAVVLWGVASAMQYGFTNGQFDATSLAGAIDILNIGTIGMNVGRQTFIYSMFTIATITNLGVFIATAVNDNSLEIASREGKTEDSVVGYANLVIYLLVLGSTLAYLLVYVLWQWQSGWFITAPRDAYDAVGNPWMFINLFAALCLMFEVVRHFITTMSGARDHIKVAAAGVTVDVIKTVNDDEEFKPKFEYDGFRVGVKIDSWFFHSFLALTASIFTQFYLSYSNFFTWFVLLISLPMFMSGWQTPKYIWQYFNICMMVYGMTCFFPYLGTFGSAPTWSVVKNPWIYQLTTWGKATNYVYGTQQVKVVIFGTSVYALTAAAVGWGTHAVANWYGHKSIEGAIRRFGMSVVGGAGMGVRRTREGFSRLRDKADR